MLVSGPHGPDPTPKLMAAALPSQKGTSTGDWTKFLKIIVERQSKNARISGVMMMTIKAINCG